MIRNIEDDLQSYIEQVLVSLYGEKYEFSASNYEFIELNAESKERPGDRCGIIRIGFNHQRRQVFIPNIYLPEDLRYKGTGKKLIYIVYYISKQFKYDVYVADLTDSFRARLLKRGALETGIYDMLEIVESTVLLSENMG
ncbi:hypothetical protein [uncultured Mucilaginibacter sp.]|uniref:hypothetical protein n=1 Tax=uncultured Mucilaginibacter sp. TaxID=797541 RepID=UPI0025ED0B7E|nr:hypothetical protein [uncultured Mucilaginibacter sp.]